MNFLNIELYIYIKFFISLFIIINPIGMIPIFISFTNNQTIAERNRTNIKTNYAVMIILCVSLFFGNYILNIFNISIESFRIAGGLLILKTAISMINGDKLSKNLSVISKNKINSKINHLNKNTFIQDVSIIPLAIPLIAGPGAISSVIIWSVKYSNFYHLIGFSVTIFLFSFFCWLIFQISPYIIHFINYIYIKIMMRIMGLLLLSLGIEFIIVSIKSILFNYL